MTGFETLSLPDKPIDGGLLLETVGSETFAIFYDFAKRSTSMIFSSNETKAGSLSSVIPGLGFSKICIESDEASSNVLSLYRSPESMPPRFLSDLFDNGIKEGFLCVVFVAQEERELSEARAYMEKRLSGIRVGSGYSVSDSSLSSRINRSSQHQDFTRSDESSMLNEMLESLNRSILANGLAYKVAFIPSKKEIGDYLLTKMLVVESHYFNGDILRAMEHVRRMRSVPFGVDFAKRLINFYGPVETKYTIPTGYARTDGPITLGSFMKDSVGISDIDMKVDSDALNLGFIISGLPGSGKTKEAMAIIDSVTYTKRRPKLVVISPTDEWNAFALSHRMHLIKLCSDKIPVNLFRCPTGSDVSKFYQSLGMVLSSASAAGPYRNPLEKCMLNAFRRVYAKTGTPNPPDLLNEIQESIIGMHGKRTHAGVKYTKHGENIKSSLENLIAILEMPEYSCSDGIHVEELVGDGIVFDISNAGIETRSHFYALILNQIYSIASSFDSNGDNELRLLLCLEEAQMMLKDPRSPIVEDIRYRIQDFRKKGIGLMLLAHNVSDIELGIRRLCQLKIYLKQAADVAETAAKDLVFANVDQDVVSSKLKHLDSRIGALSYVSKEQGMRISHDTVFIRTKEYADSQ